MDLIIVESPTKANTFLRLLNKDKYNVQATFGHIRDLPTNKLAVNIKKNFQPSYIVPEKSKKIISKIKSMTKKAQSVILATDSDREGESIAYHVAFLLGMIKEKWPSSEIINSLKIKRIIFHEITKDAIEEALKNPQELNLNLVNSQQARRILDRIVGYLLSPILWKKIGKNWLSAGRVQTVTLRFIVEREKEINKFQSESYFKIEGEFVCEEKKLLAFLVSKDGNIYEKKVVMNLFDGQYTYSKTTIDKNNIDNLKDDLKTDQYQISDIKISSYKRYPPPPYITSSLQQDASRQLGFSSKYTMKIAQDLYEKGLISYHRTDSVFLSQKFLFLAKKYINDNFGKNYSLEKPRLYKTKSKLAQEAHEAIRPTNLFFDFKKNKDLTVNHQKLYQLIFKRALASQMKEAEIEKLTIKITGKKGYLFQSEEERISFDGFLKIYNKEKSDIKFVNFNQGQKAILNNLIIQEKTTQPPPRYNEASLIRTLEEKGIGRPSTYAPIISTILDRQYVEKKEGRFHPTILGIKVSDYLSQAFPDIFEVNFTAKMEDELDQIAQDQKKIVPVLNEFYAPFEKKLNEQKKNNQYINIEEKTEEKCPECQNQLVIRFSRFGKFFACSNYPQCKFTKSYLEKINKKCPKCQAEIIIRFTKKKKKFYGCANYPKCDFASWKMPPRPTRSDLA